MARRRPSTSPSTPPPPGRLRADALRLLGRRDYTARELSDRLVDLGHAREAVSDAVDALRAEHLLDDLRTAGAHVRTASRVKGRGPLRIRRELEARGIPADVIREATSGLTDDEVRGAIDRFLMRRRVRLPVSPTDRPRVYRQLLSRGFPPRLVSEALRFRPEEET